MKNIRLARSVVFLAHCVALLISCGCRSVGDKPAPDRPAVTVIWPAPPAKARFRFLRDIEGSTDFGMKLSWWRKTVNLVTGWDRGEEIFVRPFAVCMDSAANVCLTDAGTATVYYFDRKKKKSWAWTHVGKERLKNPVAVAAKDNMIFVADSGLNKVMAISLKGKLLFELDSVFERPVGLLIVANRLYVADSKAHCIKIFDMAGKLISQYGVRGINSGEFNFPTHLAADKSGRIYVTDSMNHRVQIFSGDGEFLRQIGSAGDSSGHFARPKGIAVDERGYIYVLDALFDNVQIFSNEGVFLLDIGGRGEGPGEFWMPVGIVTAADGVVYITDSYNKRLQVLEYLGE